MEMAFFYVALVLSLGHLFLVVDSLEIDGRAKYFSVVDFGAVGDGKSDDTQAFLKAWASTCAATSHPSVMLVPRDKTFFVKPITFQGPCKSSHINFEIKGTIIAPDAPSAWDGTDASQWLLFYSVDGLTVVGPGKINGRGYNWWKQSCKSNLTRGCTTAAPTAMKFYACNDLTVSHLTSVDSAQMHFLFLGCERVGVNNVTVQAPETSPNTDGIHIQASKHVRIEDSGIGTGDDCVSIGDYAYDIVIRHTSCGPGHGISIGSLGRGGTEASVEEVHVEYVTFRDTMNGARIKTWQGAKGFARGISFEHCTFDNVQNPIIIDQYYRDTQDERLATSSAVAISNVTYVDFQGTSKTLFAVSMNCSTAIPCKEMHFDTLNLTMAASEADTKAYCINAHGNTKGFIHPALSCLQLEDHRFPIII